MTDWINEKPVVFERKKEKTYVYRHKYFGGL